MQPAPDSPATFDDPALKAAVRRVWGDVRAPVSLRDGLTRAIRGAPGKPRWARNPLLGLATAAAVLLAVGAAVYHFALAARPAVLPAALARDLVATHDHCCSMPDHHESDLPRDDFAAISRALRGKLGMPVLAAAPEPSGWTFRGAAVCSVGDLDSAHLVFKRGAENVSVFSLAAASACPQAPSSGETARMEEGHPIAAFVAGGGFYAVVGSSTDGSLTIDEVRSMRDRLRPQVAAAAPAASNGAVALSQ